MQSIQKVRSLIFVTALFFCLSCTQTSHASSDSLTARATNKGLDSISHKEVSEIEKRQTPSLDVQQSKEYSPLLLLTEVEKVWLQNHKKIRLSGPRAFPPFHFFDANGKSQGIAADYIDLICDLLQITPDVQNDLFWPEVLKKAKDKEIDLISISGKSADREEYLSFTESYLSFPLVIVTKKNTPFVGGMKDLHEKKIALVEGNVIYGLILKDKLNVVPYFVKTPLEALQAVSAGNADAAVENLAAATYLILHNGLVNIKIAAPTHYQNYDLYVAVRRDWPELVSIINKVLSIITPEQHTEILNRWLNVRYEYGISKTDVSKWILTVIGIFAGIFLIIALWNRRLQREINERKHAEHVLSESETRFKALHNASFGGIMIHDDGVIIECNRGLADITGYSTAELIGMDGLLLIAEESRNDVLKLMLSGYEKPHESIGLRKNGEEYPIRLEARNVPFKGKTVRNVEFRDITEQKQAEKALRLTRFSIEHASESMFWNTPDGRIVDVNEAACRSLGYTRQELLQLSLSDIAPYHSKEVWSQHFEELKKCGSIKLETEQRTKDGSFFPVEVVANYVQFGAEELNCAFVRDITDRKRVEDERLRFEKQLLHTQKLESLGVMAGGIAHDFNNLLMSIMGNADLALMRLNPESPAVGNLKNIEKATARAAELAKQMLAYSGKGKFVVETLDLNTLLKEMLHMLEVAISKKAVMRLNQFKSLPPVEADATQLRQIIMNLVINASEAIGDKSGVIAINTGCMDCDRRYLNDIWLDKNISAGLYVYLEIADTGCGMDRETMSKIFDPFFTTKFTGRGLGMAAVLGIVRSHKGAIKIYSEVDKGTSFKILLPASEKSTKLFNKNSSADDWKGSGTVLLVDDEESVRAIGVKMLKVLGFETITANDGREAVEQFRNNPGISFVILDLTMPHMDGEQCFRELRQLQPDIKVIISSGFSDDEVTQKFVGKGLAGFIQKPYKLNMLKEAVKKI